jgi:hypothetical protein
MVKSPRLICISIFCYLVLCLPLSITNIVLGIIQPGTCDTTDQMGLNIGDYLLGSGIAGTIFAISHIFLLLIILLSSSNIITGLAAIFYIFFIFVSIMYSIAWFVVGAIILFRSNIECIKVVSSHVIYALVIWCLSALNILNDCVCSVKVKKTNQ